ncbi:MAG: NADH-quinone oxidoreductase subunit J [bacterium]
MHNFGFEFTFYAAAALVLVTAAIATFAESIVSAAFALFFTLAGMAGLYLLLGADFLAVTQVIIYVGGILVLMLFGVLLTNRSIATLRLETSRSHFIVAGITGAIFFAMLLVVVSHTTWKNESAKAPSLVAQIESGKSEAGAKAPLEAKSELSPTTGEIGANLLSKYLLPFEISSMTLLVALLGAAYLVRRRET